MLVRVVLAGEGLALILALAPASGASPLTYFGSASLLIQWVALLTLGALFALRRQLARLPPQRLAWIALALLIASTLAVSAWTANILGPRWLGEAGGWWVFSLRMLAMATTVGLLGLVAFQNHWRARQAAVRTKQAELEALQARIRPHFLFNTLNTATALVHREPARAEEILLDLADLFRAALAGPREISLDEELRLVRRYLEIESLRFGDRLRVDWDLPASIPAIKVPSLSVQPLVENAVRHGVERVERGGRIEIALTTTVDHVLLRIRNPLVLGDASRPTSHRVGLSASQARIEALTDGRGSVETGIQGEHYVATIRLPRPRPANRRE
ncbi:alginate biosynthesis two-component system sensor histidine kinase AlgZ [Lysobacter humi (ex Lee et al. 2017)]